jgi:sulfur-oxidizing protein SoxY
MIKRGRNWFALGLLWAMCAVAPARAQDGETENWHKVRDAHFAGRSFEASSDAVVSRGPEPRRTRPWFRSHSRGALRMRTRAGFTWSHKNPSPLGAVFTLTPDSGRADIETRIRIETTAMRAIAETNDGKLYMAMKFVKASGGCRRRPARIWRLPARFGRMKFAPMAGVLNQPNLAELMISHPNVSGLAMDQVTRLYAPPRFVRTIQVSYAGKLIMSADVDFTISENPNFRFYFVPRADGELKAEVVDSSDATFETSVAIRSAGS